MGLRVVGAAGEVDRRVNDDQAMGTDLERLSRRDRDLVPTTVADNKVPVGKMTLESGAGGAAWAVRSKILALRAEGNAASKQGVTLLVRLVTRPDDVFAVEAFLATGVIERNPGAALAWAPAIATLSSDSKQAYEAAIRLRGGGGLDAVLAKAATTETTAVTRPTESSETQVELSVEDSGATRESEPTPQTEAKPEPRLRLKVPLTDATRASAKALYAQWVKTGKVPPLLDLREKISLDWIQVAGPMDRARASMLYPQYRIIDPDAELLAELVGLPVLPDGEKRGAPREAISFYWVSSTAALYRSLRTGRDNAKPTESSSLDTGTSSDTWSWVWNLLKGDFNQDPDTAQTVINGIAGLIPGLDQILDARDLCANLYGLVYEGRYDDPFTWFAFVTTLIGAIPEVGSVLKTVARVGAGAIADISRPLIRSILGWAGDSSRLTGWVMEQAQASFRSVKQNLTTILETAGVVSSAAKAWVTKLLTRTEEALKRLPARAAEALRQIKKKFDELTSSLRKTDEVDAPGVKTRPDDVPTSTTTPNEVPAKTNSPTTKADANKTDTTKTDANKTDTTKTDTNKTDTNKTDTIKTDANKTDANKTDANKTDANKTDAVETTKDTPQSEVAKQDAVQDLPTERPPLFDNDAIFAMAKKTEKDVNNLMEGTCATAALRNTISAQLKGARAYVIEIEGPTALGRMLDKLGIADGNVGKLLAKLGDVKSAHAIAAVQAPDGSWRYISWGRVEADWQVFAREAYGEEFLNRGAWETGDHVRWMVAHKWEYPNPTGVGKLMRALFGWSTTIGK